MGTDAVTFLKVLAVFIAVVFAMKRRVPMGIALSAGGLAVALLMGKAPAWIAQRLAGGWNAVLFSEHTVQFVSALGMVVALSYVLDRAGQIERMTKAFRGCFRSPRVTLATLPAIIGLLPMPAGALFSAPMVEASAAGTALDNEDKALINYWYRHVWEYAWPLYPGVLFSAQLMHLDTRIVSMWQAPLCLAAIAGGFLFLRKASAPPAPREGPSRAAAAKDAVIVLLPFLVIFALHLVARLNIIVSVGSGLLVTCLWHAVAGAIGWKALLKTLFANKGVLDMMVMGYGAKIFGEMMAQSGAIGGITSLFQSMHLPVIVLAVALPMVVGFFAGMTIVYVMTTFPVILAYPGVGASPLGIMIVAFASGYCGTLRSPVPACLVVSAAYFKCDLAKPILRMIVPCLLLLGTALVMAFVYGRFHP